MITETPPVNILLVDDALSVRQALRWLLEEVPRYKVVGEAADGDTAVQLCRTLRPDVVILDITLPQQTGFEVTYLLKETMPVIRVVLLSGHGDLATRQRAEAAGVDGFVEKSEGGQALLQVLADVIKRKSESIN